MAVINWPIPINQTELFQFGIDQMVSLKRIAAPVTATTMLPIYTLGLRDIMMNDNLVTNSEPVGWRHFAGTDSPSTAISGDVKVSGSASKLRVAHGKAVSRCLSALSSLQTDPTFSDIDVEPRLLRIPGLLVECLWITSMQPPSKGGRSWVLPYNHLFQKWGLDAEKLYASGEFFGIIQPLADFIFKHGSVTNSAPFPDASY